MKQGHIEIKTPTKLSQIDTYLLVMANCINDLQDRVNVLEGEIKRLDIKSHATINKPRRPRPGDYYESEIEGMNESTRTPGLTWKQEYERDLKYWKKKYGN